MADIVQSLFGITPESYQQAQAAQADRMALEYAQLKPLQQAQFAIGRGAYQLAGALGGEDPQLRMVSTRNAIAKQIDYTNPESMSAGIQALSQAGDTVGAMQLSQVLRQMQSEIALRGQREAAAAASKAAAERDRTPESLAKARRRAEIARALAMRGDMTPAEIEALEIEARSLMSKEELDAEEIRRQAAGYQTMIGGAQAPAARAAAEPGLMEDLASMGVFAPSQAPSMAAQPAATAETGDLATQLAQAREEFSRVSMFPKVPAAAGRAAQLKPIIESLEKRLVNVRLDDQYRAFTAANPNALQAPEASLPAREQLAIRQSQLTRISDQSASGSPLAKRDEDFIKEEIKALRDRIKEEEKPFNAGEEREAVSREKFNGRPFRDLKPTEVATVNRVVQERATSRAAASRSPQETEFSKRLGVAQGNIYEGAITTRNNAKSAIDTIQRMSDLNDQGLISGAFATGRTGFTNFLDTVGLLGEADKARLARSEQYQKVAGDAVLATLGGRLGAGFSNEDRKFIQGLVPQLENSALARRKLLEFMEKKNKDIFNESQRLINYAESNKTLNGFVPKVPLPEGSRLSGLQGLTDDQLREQLRQAKERGK